MDDNRARVGLSNLHYEEESLNTLLHLNRLFSAKREPGTCVFELVVCVIQILTSRQMC